MNNMNNPLFIYPEDVVLLERRSIRYAQALLQTIRATNGKLKHQGTTVAEYAAYKGIPEEEVRKRLA
ncbi:hypothetical protein SAMN05216436_13010 [bacterium A37T11]|nr:hypothetical protein SAMN05216436_13010 [bacterium A37T11]